MVHMHGSKMKKKKPLTSYHVALYLLHVYVCSLHDQSDLKIAGDDLAGPCLPNPPVLIVDYAAW